MNDRPRVQALVRSIATMARAVDGGYVNKTKLLKLLYLLDVEFFRRYGRMLTAFEYIFYRFGPWDATYDGVLAEMKDAGDLRITPGSRTDLDTQFIDATDPLPPDSLFSGSEEAWLFKQVIRPWLDQPTGRILDYVYFSTEPMIGAQKNEMLDFGKIDRSTVRYVRAASVPSPAEKIKAMRRRIINSTKTPVSKELRLIPAPRFDQVYQDSVAVADSDD